MVNQIDEEAYLAAKEIRKMRKKREGEKAVMKEGAYLSTDLQAAELSGQGLRYKLVGDEVSGVCSRPGIPGGGAPPPALRLLMSFVPRPSSLVPRPSFLMAPGRWSCHGRRRTRVTTWGS